MKIPYIDVLSPIDTLIGKAQHGRMHRFSYCATPSYNGFRVEKLLRRYGIRVWGRRVDGEKRSFLVKQRQAVWAEYILCRAGVPLVCPLLDPRNAQYVEKHPVNSMPVPWNEKGISAVTLIDHLGEWMAKLIG
jgi:hypothetical protein